MKSILISIRPKWCELIASGKKKIEIRKARPKCNEPFKCYIYCTEGEALAYPHLNKTCFYFMRTNNGSLHGRKMTIAERNASDYTFANGKVIGEFVCDEITKFAVDEKDNNILLSNMELQSCVGHKQLEQYAKANYYLYGWHISNIVIYDKPKDLDDFMAFGKTHCDQKNCGDCLYMGIDGICDVKDIGQPITRPPQSWCYVEELKE